MKAVAETHRVENFADAHFGLSVASVDARHVVAALLGSVDVGHRNPIISLPMASITFGTTALPN